MKTLTSYLGTGYSFGIHRLAETFRPQESAAAQRARKRPVHILIISDNDMFSMLDSKSDDRPGWDVAATCLPLAGGGGTFVLGLPEAVRSPQWSQPTTQYLARIRDLGWGVSLVDSMEELVEFARLFSRLRLGAS
jgi:hypothetical protein